MTTDEIKEDLSQTVWMPSPPVAKRYAQALLVALEELEFLHQHAMRQIAWQPDSLAAHIAVDLERIRRI